MRSTRKTLAVLAILALLATGCGGVQGGGQVHQIGGGLLGGIGGGIAGAQIGGGSGRVAAIIGGTILGAALGSYVGGYMDRMDQQQVSRTLETQPTGQTSQWRNPDTGHQYHVTPVNTFQKSDGQYCREFRTQVEVGGKLEEGYGTACRMPDGAWKMQ
ncbi:Surface antigen [Desulfonatronum thiosulfatophilum]|uniref:Surface antigen n=1 Tax=Desulfonatronum thiosulfatophilum TaxID=617002 RepID=A0A1G6BD06_9BACT|nr:RT0821/Lpp0805 family surface protein [Desulfonatronum thiosulfatophilum]SDB18532.1 Surface antigen [Desulfonatronum thiosulfatophilum]